MNYAIVPAQSRAGRALINWSREKLAAEGGVPARTVADFELGNTSPRDTTIAAIRAALEAAGVEFTNGVAPGVRLRPVNTNPMAIEAEGEEDASRAAELLADFVFDEMHTEALTRAAPPESGRPVAKTRRLRSK